MDDIRLTLERLGSWLNTRQSDRERMCAALLKLNTNYTDVELRHPEGGRDKSRDIECLRDGNICFGAVGFFNDAFESPSHKQKAIRKFKSDLDAAIQTEPSLYAFVFFTNVKLSVTEFAKLENYGKAKGIVYIEIYDAEKMRMVLDSQEGLTIRAQYLSIPRSEEERFEALERKIDQLEFNLWKQGKLQRIEFELRFKEWEESYREVVEHFRVALELQSVQREKRSIIIGGRDDFWQHSNGKGWYFDYKAFVWRERYPDAHPKWIPKGGRVGGGIIPSLNFSIKWFPRSDIYVSELDGLHFHLHVTENFVDRIASVRLIVDEYLLKEITPPPAQWIDARPSYWPETLGTKEQEFKWCFSRGLGAIDLDRMAPKAD